MSDALLRDASLSADALQRVLKSVEVHPDAVLVSDDFNSLGPMTQRMVIGQLQKKSLPLQPLSQQRNGWWPLIREPFTGAWQRNEEISVGNALSYFAVYACWRLIATDVAKMALRLVELDSDGIWNETTSPAFSPVLRKPNRYQTISKFVENWILSKLSSGNTYVYTQRDNRGGLGQGVVKSMHVLDPSRVTPLVAQDGSVYYELKRDDLSGLRLESDIVPASEIIHDTYITPHHPLIGVTPLYACALPILQGLSIQGNSNTFFANGSNPGGMMSAPGAISDETAERLLATITAKKQGEILVAGDGLKFEKFTMSAVDAQLIEQLRMTAEQVCSAYGVPPYLVDIGPPPPYANFEPLLLKYHSQCIQSLAKNVEDHLDVGLGMVEKIDGRQLGTEFDIDDLIWMDTATKTTAAASSISSGMATNEVRKRFFALGPVPGGELPMMQNQMWPIKQLAERETPAAPAMPVVTDEDMDDEDDMDMAAAFTAIRRKSIEEGLYAA